MSQAGKSKIHASQILPMGQYLVVSRRFGTHAAHSGLLPLVRGLPAVLITGQERSLWRYLWRIPAIRRAFRRSHWEYRPESLTKEIALLRRMRGASGLVQFLWGEHDYLFSGRWAHRRGWKVASWFHATPAELPAFLPETDSLRYLDLALCVSRSQMPFFSQYLPEDRVLRLPLGVDTDFFTPGDSLTTYRRAVLFVGYTLRDWTTLRMVCDGLRTRLADLDIQAIVPAKGLKHLSQIPTLRARTGVSDEELRAAYRDAALLLLPLRDCTASITITEALGCGVPIVTNDVGGVREYLDDTCAFLHPPGDVEGMLESAVRLLTDPDLNQSMRSAARSKAMQFDWRVIQGSLLKIYQERLGISIRPSDG